MTTPLSLDEPTHFPGIPGSPPTRADSSRAWGAWLMHTRQELAAPLDALRSLAAMLLADARERGPAEFQADLERVHAAGETLRGLVDRLLDPAAGPPAEPEWGRQVRHELRTPLNHIVGYCDLWIEDAAEFLLDGFLDGLTRIRELARQFLARLGDLVDFAQTAHTPVPGTVRLPEMLRELIGSLPAGTAAACGAGEDTARVLVVDDNEVNRDLICRWLRRPGHAVTTAAGGREALALLAEQDFDVVLLDLIMPEVHGLQVLRQLKADERLRHLPVVMISALDEVDGAVCCIELGAEDYLSKPVNPVLLHARVNACLEKKRLRDREVCLREQVERERRRADDLLNLVLPAEVVRELKAADAMPPRRHESVAVMFCDLVGFTRYCDGHRAEDVVGPLRQLVETWEEIAVRHQVEKIKTIGDAFMAAAGLLERPVDHPALHCVRCGLEMIAAARALGIGWDLRVGIHLGPVVAGVIGRRHFGFDLWGDTVNTASRMESNGVPGAVVLSGAAWAAVAGRCRGERLETVEVKGKGRMERVRFVAFVD